MTTAWVAPGAAEPIPDGTAVETARRYGVSTEDVDAWLAAGLPLTVAGLIDPFACCNWLSWGRLEQCPALARRWQTYMAWFQPVLEGRDQDRQVAWERQHRILVPAGYRVREWWLPRPLSIDGQRYVGGRQPEGVTSVQVDGVDFWHCVGSSSLTTGTEYVQLRAGTSDADFSGMMPVLEEIVGDFRYGYKRHRRAPVTDYDGAGSCLDCALLVQRELETHGYECALLGGIICRDDLANPHFWLHVRVGDTWQQVDPSIAAIARMLGLPWQSWLHAFSGFTDTRRIILGRGASPLISVPRGPAFSASISEVIIEDARGQADNGRQCIDWVGGECHGQFTTTPLQQ